jgi:hypothetical protein
MIALSAAAVSFERGSPPVTAPAEDVVAYFAAHRAGLLAQSLLFVLSAGANLWFLSSLRSLLLRAEGGTGRVSTVAFGAGIVGVGLSAAMQAPQVALALASGEAVDPALAGMFSALMYALSTIAFVPTAMLLAAVAAVSFRSGAFPAWLAWLSALGAVAHLVASLGLVAEGGPLTPGGWVTYVVYALLALWLLGTTVVMVARAGRPVHQSGPPSVHAVSA